ncbi:DUF1553 domain-containing protein [Urbifossiella limnaea]|uniref:DUF1553 domain-containing protein n=1 Tax=Urbifossiella limnaea TaxID=2528023 RepID=A0A517Y1A4_9BACT|nr:DUF1553 domain-containing protein [Urbifossiella limnaea]QDU23542.1 hypothetical protein ETAA1_55430 [Urbifossiella limnaea]
MLPLVLLLAPAQPADAPVRVEVHPPAVALASRRATVQLVVTGFTADGRTRDLTAEAEFAPAADVVEVRDAVVRPKRNGAADLVVTAAGRTIRVPVTVTNQDAPDPVRFRTEVLAALTRQGCSSGSCHGSPQGKGGFALSLFGYDPAIDAESLVRGGLGRRLDPFRPGDSLLLKKPLMRLPHVGGKRLTPADAAYAVLRTWIAEGAKTDDEAAPACTGIAVFPGPARVLTAPHLTQQLSVRATFADGAVRDVTALATYDASHPDVAAADARGRVTGGKRGQGAVSVRYLNHMESVHVTVVEAVPGFRWPDPPVANLVDELVYGKLRQLQVSPSDVCDDATFLRRVHLDLSGLLPTAAAARVFLADPAPDKRAKVIDALLASEEFPRYWAQRSADLMRVTAKGLPDGRAERFAAFLADGYRKNTPFNEVATAILTATGSGADVPAANYFLAVPTPEDLTETTAQLFMGSRINCAKCHNHPFENWTQDDYYRISAVFSRVKKDGDAVVLAGAGEVSHPTSGKVLAPFAGAAGDDPAADRRAAFARWLTAPGNPFFARVEVNRIWAALLGRGIVHPVDDFRSSNPPANPELLDGLAAAFVKSGFDRKHVIRLVCNSHTYQRAAATVPLNAADDVLFSHARVRRLTAEQLQDAVGQVTGALRPAGDIPAELAKREGELAAAIDRLKADLPKWEAGARTKVAALPWWAGVWHSAGPLAAGAAVDPADPFAGTRWTKRADHADARAFDFGKGAGTFYLTRTVFTRAAGTAEVVLDRRRFEFTLWADGTLAFDSTRDKALAAGPTWKVPLALDAGEHRLVLKVAKPAGAMPLKLTITPPGGKAPPPAGLSAEAVELLARPGPRTPEQTAALVAARADGDGAVRGLRDQLRRLVDRTEYATQRALPEQSEFLRAFGQPKRESPCACERADEPTVDQALQMLNGGAVAQRVAAAARYAPLSDDRLADELYLAAFARFPTAAEKAKVVGYLARPGDRAEAVRDLAWAVVNTREFLLQH